MRCRLCGSNDVAKLWSDDDGKADWFRCVVCGSDSSTREYDVGIYTPEWIAQEIAATGGDEARRESVRSNCDWFPHYKHLTGGGLDFLDVGCCDGAAMAEMAGLGFRVHGFDVTEGARREGCTTIHPFFTASLFPRQYHFVLCREVIEHVEGPRQFLSELTAVTHRGGLLQVQTPRPCVDQERIAYQPAHLQIFSPVMLELLCTNHGFRVLDRRQWGTGIALLLHKVDDL